MAQNLRLGRRVALNARAMFASPTTSSCRRSFCTTFPLRETAAASSHGSYEHILTSTPRPGVAQITLNRPKKLNALSTPLFKELNTALKAFDDDSSVAAIVLTGSDKAFAAGADIAEMQPLSFGDAYGDDFILDWSAATTALRKPLIAAVNGYALGGGCELAMMADILYASAGARFGQPEVTLGTVPGAGGSQRLTRAIGKAKAMDVILTNRMLTGAEAESWGLAARCFETPEQCVEGALDAAAKIAKFSRLAVKAAKDVVNRSQELGLRDGVEFESRVFHGLFGSRDQKVGMQAFVDKDKAPRWEHR